MPYELTMVLSGILAFVKHDQEAAYRMLVPATPDPQTGEALDEEPLRPHYPHVRRGSEIFPEFVRNPGEITFQPSPVSGSLPGRLTNMADIQRFTGQPDSVDQSVLQNPGSSNLLYAYMDLEVGELTTEISEHLWDIEPLAGAPERCVKLVHRVCWTIEFDTTEVKLLDGSGRTIVRLDLAPEENEIALSNFRAEDALGRPDPNRSPPHKADEDFRWYYELLDGEVGDTSMPKGRVNSQVHPAKQGKHLPIPTTPKTPCGGSPEADMGFTHNCMPAAFPDASWDL